MATAIDRQRPSAERGAELTPVESFSLLKTPEAQLEAEACRTLDVPHVSDGSSVVDELRAEFGVTELNAAEVLLAVRLADGQHAGRLVWSDEPEGSPELVIERLGANRSGKLPAVSTQRRGPGVGGGIC